MADWPQIVETGNESGTHDLPLGLSRYQTLETINWAVSRKAASTE